MNKTPKLFILAGAVLASLFIFVSIVYNNFIQKSIYEENSQHLLSTYPDFCKKISIKYPSSPINTGPGGFAILSYFHGVFSFGMKKVKFFWSYYGGSIPCSACLYDIYLGSVVKNRPLVLCILDNGTKIDKLLIKQNKEGFCVSTLLIYFFFVFASSCLMSPSVRIFFEKSIPVTFPISFNTSS